MGGWAEPQRQRTETVVDFRNKFNQTMADDPPMTNTYDYSNMVDDTFTVKEKTEKGKRNQT